jgi:hypothetical protein
MIGQATEIVTLWGITESTDNRNNNIVGVYLAGKET